MAYSTASTVEIRDKKKNEIKRKGKLDPPSVSLEI